MAADQGRQDTQQQAGALAQHYVCTHGEARALIEGQTAFWVANCGCREQRGGCSRSRMDVCLEFQTTTAASGSGRRQIDRAGADAIMREAADKGLVARPFRDKLGVVEGICFCCDCCCGYFVDADEICDFGPSVEATDLSQCTDCGLCVDICYFGARALGGDGAMSGPLEVRREQCYGCGLCVDVCPTGAISMVARAETSA